VKDSHSLAHSPPLISYSPQVHRLKKQAFSFKVIFVQIKSSCSTFSEPPSSPPPRDGEKKFDATFLLSLPVLATGFLNGIAHSPPHMRETPSCPSVGVANPGAGRNSLTFTRFGAAAVSKNMLTFCAFFKSIPSILLSKARKTIQHSLLIIICVKK
jgi:hypothetical protein